MNISSPSAGFSRFRKLVLAAGVVVCMFLFIPKSHATNNTVLPTVVVPPPIPTEQDAQQRTQNSLKRQAVYQASREADAFNQKINQQIAQLMHSTDTIVIGEYIGEYQYYGSHVSSTSFVGGTYFFKPLKTLKGTPKSATKDKIEVKVIFNKGAVPENPDAFYKKGAKYLLLLKYIESRSNLGHPEGYYWYSPPTSDFVILLEE